MEDFYSDDAEELSDCEMPSESEENTGGSQIFGKRAVRFTEAQVATLDAYFSLGMTGIGKRHLPLIGKAVEDTKLTSQQVKVHSSYYTYLTEHLSA